MYLRDNFTYFYAVLILKVGCGSVATSYVVSIFKGQKQSTEFLQLNILNRLNKI